MKLFFKINGCITLIIGIICLLTFIFCMIINVNSLLNYGNLQKYIKAEFSFIVNTILFLAFGIYSLFQGVGLIRLRKYAIKLSIIMPVVYLTMIALLQGRWSEKVYIFIIYSFVISICSIFIAKRNYQFNK